MSTLTVVRGTTTLAVTLDDGSTSVVVSPTGSHTTLAVSGGPPGPPGTVDLGFVFIIDGGGTVVEPGVKAGFDDLPFAGEIISWSLTADAPGNIVVDLWKGPFTAYPPDSSGSITGTEKPSLSAAIAERSTTLTGWTTTFTLGDCIVPNVVSASGIGIARLTLHTRRL